MKVIFLSMRGDLLPLALRAQEAGHVVRLYVHEGAFRYRGEGLVDLSLAPISLQKGLTVVGGAVKQVAEREQPDLVIAEKGLGHVADHFHVLHCPTWGATRWSDSVALDADYAAQLTSSVGAASSKDECAAWWNGLSWDYTHIISRVTGLMAEEAGPPILAGVRVFMASPRTLRFTSTLGRLTKLMRKTHFRGPVSMRRGRLQAGLDLPAFAALSELLKGDLAGLLVKPGAYCSPEHGVAVRVSLPPYPYGEESTPTPFAVEPSAARHLWLVDVQEGQTAGTTGELGWVSARGLKLSEARKRVRRTILNLADRLPHLQYRLDAVRR